MRRTGQLACHAKGICSVTVLCETLFRKIGLQIKVQMKV